MHPLGVILAILCGAELARMAGISLAIPAIAVLSVPHRHLLEYRESGGLVSELFTPAQSAPDLARRAWGPAETPSAVVAADTPALVRVFGTALKAWWDDDALRLGAALAYYTLFAIAPVLLVAPELPVSSSTPMRCAAKSSTSSITWSGARVRPPCRVFSMERVNDGHPRDRNRQRRIRRRLYRRIPRAAGGAEQIWRVKSNPGTHLKAFVLDRLRSFGLVVAIGLLLMGSLAVTAAPAAFSAWLSRHSSSFPLV